jgi:two-component system, sensor histidine kinase
VCSGESSGLGLGLALVKRLAELHGGQVTVASEGLGRGCTFTVSLPQTTPPRSTGVFKAASSATARRRVVVIEDNDDNRESTQKLLQIAGHEVETAHDGPEGVDLALKFLPEVALIDLALPTWDGYEVAKRLRDKFGKAIRVVALSGFARDEDKAAANAAGFDDFLVKPVSLERLRDALRFPA